jgi:hypothetical protein
VTGDVVHDSDGEFGHRKCMWYVWCGGALKLERKTAWRQVPRRKAEIVVELKSRVTNVSTVRLSQWRVCRLPSLSFYSRAPTLSLGPNINHSQLLNLVPFFAATQVHEPMY